MHYSGTNLWKKIWRRIANCGTRTRSHLGISVISLTVFAVLWEAEWRNPQRQRLRKAVPTPSLSRHPLARVAGDQQHRVYQGLESRMGMPHASDTPTLLTVTTYLLGHLLERDGYWVSGSCHHHIAVCTGWSHVVSFLTSHESSDAKRQGGAVIPVTLATLHSENECGPTFVSRDARSPVHGGVAMWATEARSLPVRVPVPCTPTYPEMWSALSERFVSEVLLASKVYRVG